MFWSVLPLPFPCPRQQHVRPERARCQILESPGIASTSTTRRGVNSRMSVMMTEEGEAERRHSCQQKRMVVKRPSVVAAPSTSAARCKRGRPATSIGSQSQANHGALTATIQRPSFSRSLLQTIRLSFVAKRLGLCCLQSEQQQQQPKAQATKVQLEERSERIYSLLARS